MIYRSYAEATLMERVKLRAQREHRNSPTQMARILPRAQPAVQLSLAIGALCIVMLIANAIQGARAESLARQNTLDVWSVIPDQTFRIAAAGVPNVGWVNNTVWLI